MEETLLRDISEKYLLPFFSGASIDSSHLSSTSAQGLVSFVTPQVIGFKVNKADRYRLQFRRDQPFAEKEDPAREARVIEAFVTILSGMENELAGPLRDDLLSTFQRRVVAHAVADSGLEKQLLTVIDQMALWATRLYEGAPIASAIGIAPGATAVSEQVLNDLTGNDFCAVLSNGFDTLLEFDSKLRFSKHEVLFPSPSSMAFCPWRHSAIAEWTNIDQKRVAVVLNRVGEILVFRQGQLLFARRSGSWHFLTHQPVARQMVVPKNENIRRAIYETALDASFARTGACIGVVSSNTRRNWEATVAEVDRLSLRISEKSKAIARIVGGRKFHELERILRQELVAIDGATVIDHEGHILAVGAILQIKGGSTGGGRTAAAMQLGLLGLGLKVSQDGAISGYRPDPGKKDLVRATFKVM